MDPRTAIRIGALAMLLAIPAWGQHRRQSVGGNFSTGLSDFKGFAESGGSPPNLASLAPRRILTVPIKAPTPAPTLAFQNVAQVTLQSYQASVDDRLSALAAAVDAKVDSQRLYNDVPESVSATRSDSKSPAFSPASGVGAAIANATAGLLQAASSPVGGNNAGNGGKDENGKKHEIAKLDQQETNVTCWAAVAKHMLKELANIFIPEKKVVEEGTGSSVATTGDDKTMRAALAANGVKSERIPGNTDIQGRYGGQMDKVDIAMFGYIKDHVTYLKRFNNDGTFTYLDPQSPGEHQGNTRDLHADFYVVANVKDQGQGT